MEAKININWGDVRNGNTEVIAAILKPLIEQGFNKVQGWAMLNHDTEINTLGIDLYRGSEKLKVKLFHPTMIQTSKGIVRTPDVFWCTTLDRMETLQDNCELYGVTAKLNCPALTTNYLLSATEELALPKPLFRGRGMARNTKCHCLMP